MDFRIAPAALAVVVMASLAFPALAQTAPTQSAATSRPWTAQDPAGARGHFHFMGHPMGEPVDKAFPDRKNAKDAFGFPLCRTTDGLPGFLDCEDHSQRRIVDGIPRVYYEGVEVQFILLRYLKDKLVGFTVSYEPGKFKEMAATMSRVYGPPFHTEIADWKGRVGHPYDTAIHTWNTPHGIMKLQERGTVVGSGTLMLMEPSAERRYQALRYRETVD